MKFNIRRFIDLLLLPLYGYYFKLTIYFRNQQVKAGFRREPFIKPGILIAGITAGVFLLLLLFWILIDNTPPVEKIENTIPPPSSENQQVAPEQNSTVITTQETNEELSKEMELLPFVKKDEEKVRQNEIEVNNEVEITGEVEEAKKEIEIKGGKEEEDSNAGNVIAETYMKVSVNNVNIRTKPSLESDIIARLEQGYMIKKLDSEGDWIFVDPGEDFKGWIYYDLLENVTEDEYKSWKNDTNQPVLTDLTRKNLDNPDNLAKEKKKIEKLLDSWKSAWEEKDIEKYMSFYSKAFTKSDYNWEGYKKYKQNIFDRPGMVSIGVESIKVDRDNFLMVASFIQKYQSGAINSTTRKSLYFQQENESWKIIRELLVNRDL